MPHAAALLLLALVSACARPDILDRAAANPRGQQVSAGKGGYRTPRYGDRDLEEAEVALADIPRPWTVERIAKEYASARDPKRRTHLLRVLAASRDPRGAIALGEALHDDELDVRVAATMGLHDYFLPYFVGGNLESAMTAADEWWARNEADLRKRAAAMRAK